MTRRICPRCRRILADVGNGDVRAAALQLLDQLAATTTTTEPEE